MSALISTWAAVTGIAPHVLHHVGPLAGAAFLAGTTGRIAFGLVAFVLTVPLLVRVRRRCGNWRIPIALLGVFVIVWSASTFLIGPRLYEVGSGAATVEVPSDDEEHPEHHDEGDNMDTEVT